jgi:molybdopterin-guanine dinucleotide biosynthesis protein A
MDDSAGMPIECPASAVVLAGGQSERLGSDKALLSLDGQPLLARTVGLLGALSRDVIVVTNDLGRYAALHLPARLVVDERPGLGSLMGVYSGLKAARNERAVVVGCDMPFLSLELLRYMLALATTYDVVIPRLGGMVEPLHAVYSRNCLPPMARVLAQGRRQIIAFFPEASADELPQVRGGRDGLLVPPRWGATAASRRCHALGALKASVRRGSPS